MNSIKEIFRIGHGPSSSHTMGPRRAANIFKLKHPECKKFKITLYGSLALTGKGHFTDIALNDELKPASVEIIWEPTITLPTHPNGITFEAIDNNGITIDTWTTYSIGGGALWEEKGDLSTPVYPHKNMNEILHYINNNGKSFWEYVEEFEG